KIGAKVQVAAAAAGGGGPEPLLTGEVTALEADYSAHGAWVLARGYDPSHRLHRGRQTETYRNVKDSDIVRTVAGRCELAIGEIEETDGTYDHVSQANLSAWEFLKASARAIGVE